MKKYILSFVFVFGIHFNLHAVNLKADAVRVSDQEAVLLFRYVEGAGVPLLEDTQNQILHAEVMMCSIYFNSGIGPQRARCMLPHEQE